MIWRPDPLSTWQVVQRSHGGFFSQNSLSLACGLWQMVHMPVAVGPCWYWLEKK